MASKTKTASRSRTYFMFPLEKEMSFMPIEEISGFPVRNWTKHFPLKVIEWLLSLQIQVKSPKDWQIILDYCQTTYSHTWTIPASRGLMYFLFLWGKGPKTTSYVVILHNKLVKKVKMISVYSPEYVSTGISPSKPSSAPCFIFYECHVCLFSMLFLLV